MRDNLLPVADSKTKNSFLRSAYCSHVMTLMVRLALLSTAATAIGLYCFQSDILLSSPDLTQITSSYMCVFDDGRPEHRVCKFHNLLIYESTIHYIYSGPRPDLPVIMANWHHDYYFQAVVTRVHELTDAMKAAPVMRIKAATLTWRQWHLNWYHGMGESIFEIYSSACTYLDYCGSQRNSSELTPIFIENPGDEKTWEEALPPAASALKCLYPTQAWWIKDKAIQDKVLLVETAVAGIGPFNRKWKGFEDKGAEFHSVYEPVPEWLSHRYRDLLVQCYDVKWAAIRAEGPYEVTLVNRQYHKGRSMVNTAAVIASMKAMEQVSSVKLVYMEVLTFRQQLEAYAKAQVLVMGHGAAFANIMFMAPDSVVIVYNWIPTYTANQISPHSWITEYMKDLALPVNFVGTSTDDRRHILPQKEKLINQPEYKDLNSTEKLALLEHGVCPQTPLPGCHEMTLNFVVDWPLLEEAVKVAFANLRSRHSTVLDGTDPYHK
ncbi:hypothetical protein WJX77_006813 [Trebouxia sp. C0004]